MNRCFHKGRISDAESEISSVIRWYNYLRVRKTHGWFTLSIFFNTRMRTSCDTRIISDLLQALKTKIDKLRDHIFCIIFILCRLFFTKSDLCELHIIINMITVQTQLHFMFCQSPACCKSLSLFAAEKRTNIVTSITFPISQLRQSRS